MDSEWTLTYRFEKCPLNLCDQVKSGVQDDEGKTVFFIGHAFVIAIETIISLYDFGRRFEHTVTVKQTGFEHEYPKHIETGPG